MMQRTRAATWSLTLAAIMAGLGCQSTPGPSFMPAMSSLAEDLQPFEPEARLARMQGSDFSPPPSTSTDLPSLAEQKAAVRAYINGKPLFDYEVLNIVMPRLRAQSGRISPAEQQEFQTKAYNSALEDLIDQEVVYQEAVRRLENNNPKALDKLKEIAAEETDKRLQDLMEKSGSKIPPEVAREQVPMMRRHMERSIVFSEYLRSRIKPIVESRIGLLEIRDYYEAHKNEFVRVDTVEWQDIFLAVGPKYPTLADARRMAEQIVARVRTADDFARYLSHDDGDSKFRGGKGFGARRGEIRPAELEEYLFKMRDGEIGPIVELSTGVHIFRLIKREMGGQIPLNEEIQKQIRGKLQNQLFEIEARRIIRELRARSVIEIEG